MSDHKFEVGQNVQFSPDWPLGSSSGGRYTIVRLYPKVDNTPQYRIKSSLDGHERVVTEDRLDRPLGSAPTENGFALMPK